MTQLDFIEQEHQRQASAQATLQRIVDEQRESFAVQDYAKRRQAALKHVPRVWA